MIVSISRSVTYLSPTAFPNTTVIIYATHTPTGAPVVTSTNSPTFSRSVCPSALPESIVPSITPTVRTNYPSYVPSISLAPQWSANPSPHPSSHPSDQPTSQPSQQPNQAPTGAPSFKAEPWGDLVTDGRRRRRTGGLCDNHCSHHGTCEMNSNCNCFVGLDGEPEWTGPDCSLRTCPKDFAWVGSVVGANGMCSTIIIMHGDTFSTDVGLGCLDLHPWVECSNKGMCDRTDGICDCFTGY